MASGWDHRQLLVLRHWPRSVVRKHVDVGWRDGPGERKQAGGRCALQPARHRVKRQRAQQQAGAPQHLRDAGPAHVEGRRAREVVDAPGAAVGVHVQEALLDGEVRDAGGEEGHAQQRPRGLGKGEKAGQATRDGGGHEAAARGGADAEAGEDACHDGGLRGIRHRAHRCALIPRCRPWRGIRAALVALCCATCQQAQAAPGTLLPQDAARRTEGAAPNVDDGGRASGCASRREAGSTAGERLCPAGRRRHRRIEERCSA
mmetsp:Transcript_19790/g.49970  ORF Transcript_19790/g.49970 Transcript_19790/m.49970 type:complete len:260 (-) Transcript_19790:189-968(-)